MPGRWTHYRSSSTLRVCLRGRRCAGRDPPGPALATQVPYLTSRSPLLPFPGPKNEGWGITYDASNQEFVVSDGTNTLYFWDRDTLAEKRRVAVTRLDGRPQDQLNELEFMDGLVCCNIWHEDDIICVDPTTGKSVREYGEIQTSKTNRT